MTLPKINFFTRISINVIIIFIGIILFSFIPEYFREFTGDWFCQGQNSNYEPAGCHYANLGAHDAQWHWNFRHWIWFFMGVALFIIQAFRIGMIIHKHESSK